MRRLLTVDNEEDGRLLRRKAKKVKNVQSTEVILGIQDMKRIATAWEHKTGFRCEGLAANQIGWNAQVIILRKSDLQAPGEPQYKDFVITDVETGAETLNEADYAQAWANYREWMRCFGNSFDPWYVLINTRIVHEEGEQDSEEACLSVPLGAYKVKRPTVMAFKYTMPNGLQSGVLMVRGENAIKLKHEKDHDDGILVCDSGLPLVGTGAERL